MAPDSQSFHRGVSQAFLDAACLLAQQDNYDLNDLSYFYSDMRKMGASRVFLGLRPGPQVSGNWQPVAVLLGKHLAYNAVSFNQTTAALITHQREMVNHPDNNAETNAFVDLVNKTVLEVLNEA